MATLTDGMPPSRIVFPPPVPSEEDLATAQIVIVGKPATRCPAVRNGVQCNLDEDHGDVPHISNQEKWE